MKTWNGWTPRRGAGQCACTVTKHVPKSYRQSDRRTRHSASSPLSARRRAKTLALAARSKFLMHEFIDGSSLPRSTRRDQRQEASVRQAVYTVRSPVSIRPRPQQWPMVAGSRRACSLSHCPCYPGQEHLLHALPSPRRAPQKDQAGFDAGVVGEAADVQGLAHGFPAVPLHQGPQDLLQGHAVQGVVGVLVHGAAIKTQPSIKPG